MEANGSQVEHIPVLAGVLTEQISIPQDGVMVDATLGHGGHAYLFRENMSAEGTIVGLDVSQASIDVARSCLSNLSCRTVCSGSNYRCLMWLKTSIDKGRDQTGNSITCSSDSF